MSDNENEQIPENTSDDLGEIRKLKTKKSKKMKSLKLVEKNQQ